MHQGGEQGGDHEDRKDDVAHAGLRTVGLEEGEANEETGHDTQQELGNDIGRHAPVLLEDALGYDPELGAKRHGEFGGNVAGVGGLCRGLSGSGGVDVVEFRQHTLILRAGLPDRRPVFSLVVGSIGHNLKHVLGWVLLVTTGAGTVGLKVFEEGLGVFANLAKVDGLTAGSQEEETVELLEEDRVRLVDGAENGLAGVGELAEEDADSPGRLGIQTRGGLVEEEKELGFRYELNANREQLALFNVETFAGNTDNGIGVVFHAEHLDDLFHVVVLFLLADRLWATEHGAEPKAFSDGCGLKVKVYVIVSPVVIEKGATEGAYPAAAHSQSVSGSPLQTACR